MRDEPKGNEGDFRGGKRGGKKALAEEYEDRGAKLNEMMGDARRIMIRGFARAFFRSI